MNAPFTVKQGEAHGLPVMKFTLAYDGDLRSSGNSSRKTAEKWEIRKAFHPQLAELISVHPAMRTALKAAIIPAKGVFWVMQSHHSESESDPNDPTAKEFAPRETRNLYEPLVRGGKRFFPIVRESLALTCGLKILFLRKEEPGSLVLQGGDLDNRLKTLFDALRVPSEDETQEDPLLDDPLYCLLESDTLISGLTVETGRLLSRPNSSVHEVRLVIEVDIRAVLAMNYNTAFFSD